MTSYIKGVTMTLWATMKNAFLRFPIALAMVVFPVLGHADNVSVITLEEKGTLAIFHFVEGCITTDVQAAIDLQNISHVPGNKTESVKFTILEVRQASEPANGPECADDIIQSSFFVSLDPISNPHLTVIEVSPGLNQARVAGTGSFFDVFHGIQRDMAFDITWKATGAMEQQESHDHYEDGDLLVESHALLLERDGVASGSIKECDNEFDGPV